MTSQMIDYLLFDRRMSEYILDKVIHSLSFVDSNGTVTKRIQLAHELRWKS